MQLGDADVWTSLQACTVQMSADLRPQDGAQTVTTRERSLETSINSIGTTDQASTCKENIINKMSTNHNEAAGTCNSSADIGSQSHDREIGRNHASAKAIEGRGESIPDMLKLRRPSVSSTELAVNGGECESTPDMLKTSKTDFVHCSRCDTSTGTIGGREHSLVQCFHCEASTGTVDGREYRVSTVSIVIPPLEPLKDAITALSAVPTVLPPLGSLKDASSYACTAPILGSSKHNYVTYEPFFSQGVQDTNIPASILFGMYPHVFPRSLRS